MKPFGAYDVRGIYPEEVNESFVYRVGRFFPGIIAAPRGRIAVGHDIRLSSPQLSRALIKGITAAGCDVVDIGQCGTEMIYFAVAHYHLDGGIMITASHNPREYNGMKFVRQGSQPLSRAEGLDELARQVQDQDLQPSEGNSTGQAVAKDILEDYLKYLLSYIDVSRLKPLKVVLNAGNGAAGPIIDALEQKLPIHMVKVLGEPDGSFPHGVPNPLLQENRALTIAAVKQHKADFGVAWDGDFDRCFLVDEKGQFIEGYYMVGLLAQAFLQKHPGSAVVHDPRLLWNTLEICEKLQGHPVICKSGHAFIKAKMRAVDAIYGGEMSAHHYFRDFAYCDSGMIPWLLILELLSKSGQKLSALLQDRMERYPVSGELNSVVADADAVMQRIEAKYGSKGRVSRLDGLSVEFSDWLFNLRQSNTEPVIRLNVETRHDTRLLREKTEELLKEIRS